mgnify:CR=1 FL=1
MAYQEQLLSPEGERHYEYLNVERGINHETILHFKLGAVLDASASHEQAQGMLSIPYLTPAGPVLITSVVTNADGRTSTPLLESATPAAMPGTYQLLFHVADYFVTIGHKDAGRFLQHVPVVFVLEDTAQKIHVPLLVSPWAYTTYRGS